MENTNEQGLNRTDASPIQELFSKVNYQAEGFDPEEINEKIATSLCEPMAILHRRNPELYKDPIAAIESVKLVNGGEEEIIYHIEGLKIAPSLRLRNTSQCLRINKRSASRV